MCVCVRVCVFVSACAVIGRRGESRGVRKCFKGKVFYSSSSKTLTIGEPPAEEKGESELDWVEEGEEAGALDTEARQVLT